MVITARAIDALSYHQLFPHEHTRYISTEGKLSSYQRELIVEAMAELDNSGNEIIIGYSNDEAGKQLAEKLTFLAPTSTSLKRHAPENTLSWNEMLQKQIENNKFLARQSIQRSKSKKRGQLEL